MTEAEEDHGGAFGATSLNDLRRVNQNPFGLFGRIKHWFTVDEFRGICAGFIIGSVVLTLAMIIQAVAGDGAVNQIFVLESSRLWFNLS